MGRHDEIKVNDLVRIYLISKLKQVLIQEYMDIYIDNGLMLLKRGKQVDGTRKKNITFFKEHGREQKTKQYPQLTLTGLSTFDTFFQTNIQISAHSYYCEKSICS